MTTLYSLLLDHYCTFSTVCSCSRRALFVILVCGRKEAVYNNDLVRCWQHNSMGRREEGNIRSPLLPVWCRQDKDDYSEHNGDGDGKQASRQTSKQASELAFFRCFVVLFFALLYLTTCSAAAFIHRVDAEFDSRIKTARSI